MTIIDRLNAEPVDGWHYYQMAWLETMDLRTQLRQQGVVTYLNLLVDGISLEGPSSNHWEDQDKQLMKQLFDKLRNYMWDTFCVDYSRTTTNGFSEWIWHVDNWDINWRELK